MSIYKNVMELLVEEEVVRQYTALPARVSAYINQLEWVAYALNQLPPLYATSEKGLQHQLQRGKAKHGSEIKQAVQRALAAIRRDPLRTSTPLQSPNLPMRQVLTQLRFLLRNDRLDWESLPYAVEQALEQANQGRRFRSAPVRTASVYAPVRGSSPFPEYRSLETADESPSDQLPSTVESTRTKAAPTRADQAPTPEARQNEVFGWDDPLYNPR